MRIDGDPGGFRVKCCPIDRSAKFRGCRSSPDSPRSGAFRSTVPRVHLLGKRGSRDALGPRQARSPSPSSDMSVSPPQSSSTESSPRGTAWCVRRTCSNPEHRHQRHRLFHQIRQAGPSGLPCEVMRHSDFAVAERRLRRKLLRFPSQQHDRVQPLRDYRVPARVARWRLLGEGA